MDEGGWLQYDQAQPVLSTQLQNNYVTKETVWETEWSWVCINHLPSSRSQLSKSVREDYCLPILSDRCICCLLPQSFYYHWWHIYWWCKHHTQPPSQKACLVICVYNSTLDETRADYDVCPCTKTDTAFTGIVPPFVGQDYFCDTGSRYHYQDRIYSSDPLWDGSGCGSTSSCCRFNSPPWFCKQLPLPTTDDIELRLCSNEDADTEDALIELVELYVQ